MVRRRTLAEGLKGGKKRDRDKGEAFVFGGKSPEKTKESLPKREEKVEAATSPTAAPGSMPGLTGRMPLSTRIRSDLATALKRASLERQLAGETPNTVQDILEAALEPWLKEKGYLKD